MHIELYIKLWDDLRPIPIVFRLILVDLASMHRQGRSHFILSLSKFHTPLHKCAKNCAEQLQDVHSNTTSTLTYKNTFHIYTFVVKQAVTVVVTSQVPKPRSTLQPWLSQHRKKKAIGGLYIISESAIHKVYFSVTLWQRRSVVQKV